MIRALTISEYREIEELANICMNAYSQTQAAKELKRLSFLSDYLPIGNYAQEKIGEVFAYCKVAATNSASYSRRENARSSVQNSLSVLRGFVEKDEKVSRGEG